MRFHFSRVEKSNDLNRNCIASVDVSPQRKKGVFWTVVCIRYPERSPAAWIPGTESVKNLRNEICIFKHFSFIWLSVNACSLQ